MFDVLIRGGLVLDGKGTDPVEAVIGITGDTITAIGDLPDASARSDFRLPNSPFVTPGFIDVHSHSDTYLLIEPSAPSKIYQGITTEVVGNCGASAAPISGIDVLPSDWADKTYARSWNTVAEYRQILETVRPAPNVALLVGHNTLRRSVMGFENRAAAPDELREMSELLERSLDEGARGFSTGLIYAPGMHALAGELLALAAIVAGHGGIYSSHMRNEGRHLLESINETIGIGRETGVSVEISHLKTAGRGNWELVDAALGLIRQAREEGMDVAADRYPYTSGYTELDVVLPDWVQEGGREAALKKLRDPASRSRIRDELVQSRPSGDWSAVSIGSTVHPDNMKFRGMRLPAAADRLGMEPVDAVLHLVEKDELKTGAFFHGMSKENMLKILAEPYVMLGTDASLRAPSGPLSLDYPHPRAYGSFPRFLRMSLDGGSVPLPEAVRKMTSLLAAHFHLKDRGILAKGKKADIVVFNPAEIGDKASYSNPHQLTTGIDYVIVNGNITLANGRLTGRRAGTWL